MAERRMSDPVRQRSDAELDELAEDHPSGHHARL